MRARAFLGVGLVGVAAVGTLVSTGRTGATIAGGFILGACWAATLVAIGQTERHR